MNKKQLRINKKAIAAIGVILAACLAALAIYLKQRPSNEAAPLFHLDQENIEYIKIIDGDHGGYSVELAEESAVKRIMELLNSFQFEESKPRDPGLVGWNYAMNIYLKDGGIESYDFSEDAILVDEVWYISDTAHFRELIELVDTEDSAS